MPSRKTIFLLLAPPLEHPLSIIWFYFKYFSFTKELVLGHVDVVTQCDETPFMGQLSKVQQFLNYAEETW